jgi:type II secretory pathway component GspD/PulD (secretin)
LSLQADERLNAIIAVGSASRIRTVEELIELLDAPEGGLEGGTSELSTFRMRDGDARAGEAAARGAVPRPARGDRKPTILPLDAVGKLVVVAEKGAAAAGDGAAGRAGPCDARGEPLEAMTTARVIMLEHATASSVESIARRMLTPRQNQMLRFTPTPSGRGLLVSGSPSDVAAFENLVAGIDLEPEVKREVRQVTVPGASDAGTVVARAQELDGLADEAADDPVEVILDDETRTATLVGSSGAIQRFEGRLRDAAGAVRCARRKRTYTPEHAAPSELAQRLPRLARPMLEPGDGSVFVAPSFDAIDELDTLVVRAEPEQFAVIDELIAQLDTESATGQQLRVIPVRGATPGR